MRGIAAHFFRFGAGFVCLAAVGLVLTGHAAKPALQVIPTDWTHRHVIYSQPATTAAAALLAEQTRYRQQEFRSHALRPVLDESDLSRHIPIQLPVASDGGVQKDWSQNLGSGGSTGAGKYPAKVSFTSNTANCASTGKPDFVIFGTGLLGAVGTASIVAYDNLYSGCSGTVPSVYWAYNTGGQIVSSPVVSLDGTQIAFVQTNGFIVATLVLLKWKSSTVESITNPGIPTLVPALSAYPACSAPCMAEIPLLDRGGFSTDDINSSVFYDYQTDTAWVGDSESYLHEFNPVFKGTATDPPAEVRNTIWPVQVNPTDVTDLSGPVFDAISGNIFLGDVGGFAYRVSAASGAVTKSAQLDHGVGIVASPVVDPTSEKVYVFVSNDGSKSCTGAGPCAAVVQFTTTFAAGTSGSKVTVGNSSSSPNALYDGAFDGAYEASSNATGNLYVCGNTGGSPILYQVPISAGAFKAPVAGPTLTSATTGCSPVSDVSNLNATGGAAEWMFAGVQASGSGNNCATGGCIMNFLDQPWKASTAYTVGQEVIDTHFQIQVAVAVVAPGTSGTATPNWATTPGVGTHDNNVTWSNQGPQTAAHSAWAASTSYAPHSEILDTNGNIEDMVSGTAKTSGTTQPKWNTTPGGSTIDNAAQWLNVGKLATASQAAAGGTSGIIMDNTVSSGTLSGASQIYYSTQGNQACGTSGTGGCAVQASQSALQ
jgi:hypothetical protein